MAELSVLSQLSDFGLDFSRSLGSCWVSAGSFPEQRPVFEPNRISGTILFTKPKALHSLNLANEVYDGCNWTGVEGREGGRGGRW